jgi:hypothetical protein
VREAHPTALLEIQTLIEPRKRRTSSSPLRVFEFYQHRSTREAREYVLDGVLENLLVNLEFQLEIAASRFVQHALELDPAQTLSD